MFIAWTLNLDGFQYVILIYGPILDPCGERFNFLIIVHSKKYKRIKSTSKFDFKDNLLDDNKPIDS